MVSVIYCCVTNYPKITFVILRDSERVPLLVVSCPLWLLFSRRLPSSSWLARLPYVEVSKEHSERQKAEAARFLKVWALELAQDHFCLTLLVKAARKPAQIQEGGNRPLCRWVEL